MLKPNRPTVYMRKSLQSFLVSCNLSGHKGQQGNAFRVQMKGTLSPPQDVKVVFQNPGCGVTAPPTEKSDPAVDCVWRAFNNFRSIDEFITSTPASGPSSAV